MEEDPITGPAIGLIVAAVLCLLLSVCCLNDNPGGYVHMCITIFFNGLLVY